MCMFDKFHLTFNFESKVSRDVFKNENECQATSTLFLYLFCVGEYSCKSIPRVDFFLKIH